MLPKYKAWDKVEKIMCDVRIINLDKGAFLEGNSPSLPGIVGDSDIVTWLPPGENTGHFCDFEDIVLLPSTGKIDSLGIELFLGTVWRGNIKPYDRDYVVEWDYENAGFIFRTKLEKYHAPSLKHALKGNVIGNIYDNPEMSLS